MKQQISPKIVNFGKVSSSISIDDERAELKLRPKWT